MFTKSNNVQRSVRCPKCNGYLIPNVGYPTRVAYGCINCGLTSESGSYLDNLTKTRKPVPDQTVIKTKRHQQRGRFV